MHLLFSLWTGLGGAAHAAELTEVIVYDDLFARWRDTRWLVEAELMTPLGTWLAADANRGFTSYAFQVHAVIHCNEEGAMSKRKIEVRCGIEDASIQATTFRHSGTEAAREVAQEILDGIDGKLTGAEVQLQVDRKGGVPNVDIEGLTPSNQRERAALEGLRQVVAQLAGGFHLKIPDSAQRAGQYLEHNSTLMTVPSLSGTRGSSTLVHTVSPYNDYNLVQTLGEGIAVASVPVPPAANLRTPAEPKATPQGRQTLAEQQAALTLTVPGGGRVAPPMGPPPNELSQPLPNAPNAEPNEGVEISYKLEASGVALFERASGVLAERVWTVDGLPTAGSAGGSVQSMPYRNVGRLRLLDADENPDLGSSRQVAGAGHSDLEAWVSMTPSAGP